MASPKEMSYYAIIHCCTACGGAVWTEDAYALPEKNPGNQRVKDTVCNSCARAAAEARKGGK